MASLSNLLNYIKINSFLTKAEHCNFCCSRLVTTKAKRDSVYVKDVPRNRPKYKAQRRAPPLNHPYRNLFPWKSLQEFAEELSSKVVYNDGDLIAFDKPWGVGIHVPVHTPLRQSIIGLNNIYGSPKYCIKDALELLSTRLQVNQPLHLIKSSDRYASGITLIGTTRAKERTLKSLRRARGMCVPYMKYWCLTKGYPVLKEPIIKERVGIKMIEVDELGNDKAPVLISKERITRSLRKNNFRYDGKTFIAVVEFQVLEYNKNLSSSLVELNTTLTKCHFVPCYIAKQASFVLG